jgi:hypothetical protein
MIGVMKIKSDHNTTLSLGLCPHDQGGVVDMSDHIWKKTKKIGSSRMVVTLFLCCVIHITDSCRSSLCYLFVHLYSHLVRSFPYHLPSPYICCPRQTLK